MDNRWWPGVRNMAMNAMAGDGGPSLHLRNSSEEDKAVAAAAAAAASNSHESSNPNQNPESGDTEYQNTAGDVEITQTPSSSKSGRRPRGRPPGSKNRPKPPTVIATASPNSLCSHVFNVSSGCDVFKSMAAYAERRRCGVTVLYGKGTASSVAIREPEGKVQRYKGRFEIATLSGVFLPPPSPPEQNRLTVYFIGEHGQAFGGVVVGELVAEGPVTVNAATCERTVFETLPLEDEESVGGEGMQLQPSSGQAAVVASLGPQIYGFAAAENSPANHLRLLNLPHSLLPNGHLGHDVFWRSPPPPPPY